MQNVLLSGLGRGHQLSCRNGHGVIRLLGCFLGMHYFPMQVPAQVSFVLRQSVIRLRQLQCDYVQRKLRRYYRCVLGYPSCSYLTPFLVASGFVAEESVSLGNLTVSEQPFG